LKRTLDDLTGEVIQPGERIYRLTWSEATDGEHCLPKRMAGTVELSEASALEYISSTVLGRLLGPRANDFGSVPTGIAEEQGKIPGR